MKSNSGFIRPTAGDGTTVAAHSEVLNASKHAATKSWKLHTAIVSLSNKDRLDVLVKLFAKYNVRVIATGGTYSTLLTLSEKLGDKISKLTEVSAYTGYPYNLNGRLKTLHPKVQAGVLGIRPYHDEAMKEKFKVKAEYIDLVVANLYPFEKAVEEGFDYFECIENIDIGGPALIRAGAKNHACVTVVVDPNDYAFLAKELTENDGAVSPSFRKKMAGKAFKLTSQYDSHIAKWFASQES